MPERTVTFNDLINDGQIEIGAGRPRTVSMNGQELPILRVADVLDGKIGAAASDHRTDQHIPIELSKVSRPGDIVLTTKGTVGRVALMPADGPAFAYSPQLCFFRPAANGPLRSRFLYYWFKSTEFWIQANALKGQTDMADFLSLGDLQRMQIRIPSPGRQDAIGSILGALDDKVAVNDKTVLIADELTVSLFRSWVQREALDATSLRNVATIVLGGTPDRSVPEYWTSGTINWINSGSANLLRVMKPTARITELALQKSAAKMMPQGATVLAITGATLGQVSRLEIASSGNQSLVGAWAENPAINDWLYFWIRQNIGDLTRHATGGAQQHINKSVVERMIVALPSSDALSSWHESVRPLLTAIADKLRENATLADLRDTLLPELMSGRLRVKNAEKVVEEAV